MDRTCLFQTLRWYGTPEILVRATEKIYKGRKVIIRLGPVEANSIKYDHGIIQDDALSPVLFVVLVNSISLRLNKFNKHSARLNHLFFIDDFVFFAESETEGQALLQMTEDIAREIGLVFNSDKCAALAERADPRLTLDGKVSEQFESYKYLGVTLEKN